MRFQYLRPVNTIFLLFSRCKYIKILICSQIKLDINTILTQLVIENKFKHKYSISYTQNHHQKPINKKGTEINSMPQNTYESYRLLCLIIIPNKMYEEILFDIHTTDMKTRTTTGCITTA